MTGRPKRRLCEDEDLKIILEPEVAEDKGSPRRPGLAQLALAAGPGPTSGPWRQRLAAALSAHTQAHPGPDQGLGVHGLLSGPALLALRRATGREVVEPCIAALGA